VRPIRIVLADDNPEVLETLLDLLQPLYEVAGALPDGTSLLDQVSALQPDIIILDISLPDMTGFDVVRQLKKDNDGAKIIFLTVHENVDFVRAAFDLDAAGYVFKSRISADLIEAINITSNGGRFSSAELSLPR
jgi:DNA-binding NarL/FixJ family response regulator